MEIVYSWTEDGLPERCEVQRIESTGEPCGHCGLPIAGSAVRLIAPDGDAYILHRECACDGCARASDCLAVDEVFQVDGAIKLKIPSSGFRFDEETVL